MNRSVERSVVRVRRLDLLFAGILIAVYAAALSLAGMLPELEHPGAVAAGMTADLVVTVPAAFYLLVARRRRWSILTLVPVVALGFAAAALIVPRDHQQALHVLEVLVAPLELALLGWIAWRALRALRSASRDASGDPLVRFRRAARELLPSERLAAVFASEIAVLYYGLGAWRARPHAPAGTQAFTHHERSGHAGIVLGLLLMVVAEGFAVHVLLLHWSALAAWILTALSAYGALWLIADYRATVLRPILVGEACVSLRAGLRWSLEVALAEIAEVTRTPPESEKERLKLTLLGAPTHWIVFSRPQVVEGLYGFRRRVRAVGIEPDAGERFRRELTASGS